MEEAIETHYFKDFDGNRFTVKSPFLARRGKPRIVFGHYVAGINDSKVVDKLTSVLDILNHVHDKNYCLTDLGKRDILDLANIILDVDDCDPKLTDSFVDDVAKVGANVNPDARRHYLDRAEEHRVNGIDELIDFADDVKYAFTELGGLRTDVKHSLDYASKGIDLENRFGNDARKFYDAFTKALVTGAGLDLATAKDIAAKLPEDGEVDLAPVGDAIARTNGIRDPKHARIFSDLYVLQSKNHGPVDATQVLVPAYFITLNLFNKTKLDLDPVLIANHIEPAVRFFKDRENYTPRDFSDAIVGSFAAMNRGISKSPTQSFDFAGELLSVRDAKYNVNRWVDAVEHYVRGKLSLESAMKISVVLEKHALGGSEYKVKAADNYLKLQSGLGLSEKEVVDNTIAYLNSSNGVGQSKVVSSTVPEQKEL